MDTKRMMQSVFRADDLPTIERRWIAFLKAVFTVATWTCVAAALLLVRHLGNYRLPGQIWRVLLSLYLGFMAYGIHSGWKLWSERRAEQQREQERPLSAEEINERDERNIDAYERSVNSLKQVRAAHGSPVDTDDTREAEADIKRLRAEVAERQQQRRER